MVAPAPNPAPDLDAGVRRVRWLPPVLQPTVEELLPRTRTDRTRRDWLVDLAVTALVLAGGIADLVSRVDQGRALASPAMLGNAAALAAVLVALFFRRRWPLEVTALVAVLAAAFSAPGLAGLVMAFAVAAYTPPPRALLGLAMLLAGVPISAALWPDEETSFAGVVLLASVMVVGLGAWGMYTGTRRQLLATLRERARRAEAEQSLRAEQAREQERARIAREMHDVLAHRMSLLSLHAGALEFRPDAPPEQIAQSAGIIRHTAHEALEELRAVIGVLRAGDLTGAEQPEPPQPTLADVPALVEDWRAAGARIDLRLGVDPAVVPSGAGRAAYRVVQEGLTNAGKHAPDARVDVRVDGTPGDRLHVAVVNPLAVRAAPTEIPGTGLGLVGLRERAALAGGSLSAGVDGAARSFRLEVDLPWGAA